MRRALGVVALIVAVGATGACGNKKTANAQEIISGAPRKTAAASTAKVSETMKITGGSLDTPTVNASGVIDFATGKATLAFDLLGQSVKVVIDGATMYERIPGLESQLGGKPWFKISLDDLGKVSGVQGFGNLVSSNNDSRATLDTLRGAGSIEFLGYQKVRGVDTSRYQGVIDLEAAARQSPPAQQATMRQIIAMQGTSTQPVDVWVDKQGRVRRLSETVDMTKATPPMPGATLPSSIAITLEYYAFGTPVRVEVPPADQTTDLGPMLLKLSKGQGSGNATPGTSGLEARLLASVPAGYQRQADSVGDTGPSDLDKAVRDDGAPDARQVLTRDGFLGGYQRLWQKGPAELIDFVYRFAAPAGAADYTLRSLADMRSTPGTSEFAVAGVPGAKGVRHADADGTTVVVMFARGTYASQVVVNGADANPAFVTRLAQQQYAKLA
jgi:hypothetical protein